MDTRTNFPGAMTFRPELFFLGRTEGHGVVRDPLGRVARRCRVETIGDYSTSRSAIEFEEVFTYDDGEVDVWRWVMTQGSNGMYVAAEAVAGAGITGYRQDEDYVLTFRRAVGPAKGLLSPSFKTRFTMVAPGMALKTVQVSLLGVPLGVMTATHQRVAD
ncbi:MAG: DUF3833 family protein [Proteobacteria bacterium]|nr:DUF3833 family protein [Pseudomonadota bacterium]